MKKIDQLYMENLTEYVFDEKKFVSYKFISVKLGVHVNLAKQMLYHFYDTEKSKGKKIYATYYLSGLAPQKWISSLNAPKDETESNQGDLQSQRSSISQISQESCYDKDAYLVLLCKDHELEDMKRKFSRLYSVHVYALSSSPCDNFDVLTRAVEKPLRDDDGNGPVHYGPITCKAAFEYREDPRLAPLLKNVEEVKANLEKVKEKHDQGKVTKEPTIRPVEVPVSPPSNKGKQENNTATKKPNNSLSTGGGDNRLKNMFATAASRPKPKEVEQIKENVEKEIVKAKDTSSKKAKEEKSNKSSYAKNKNKKNVKESPQYKEIPNRKRKRIRDDIFPSSSDEEDNAKMSDDDDADALPESPIPRKRIQIESDSEDDFKEETPKKTNPEPVVEKSASGKRRVSKTVPKRHVDEDGFLVTVMEQVMVSESDNSDEEGDKSKNVDSTKLKSKSTPEKPSEKAKPVQAASASKNKKESAKTTSSSSTAPKTKQASIMSFFQKK